MKSETAVIIAITPLCLITLVALMNWIVSMFLNGHTLVGLSVIFAILLSVWIVCWMNYADKLAVGEL